MIVSRNGKIIVSAAVAGKESLKTRRRLEVSPRWKPALSGATRQKPRLVQRLDRDDSYYYIVEYRRQGKVTARIIVDGTTGRYMETKGIEHGGETLSPFKKPLAPPVDLRSAALRGQSIRMPDDLSRVIRSAAAGAQPVLYWRPCRESKSPFRPFYLRLVGGEFIYVRVDGERFKELTDGPA